jgi:hypothetical protein
VLFLAGAPTLARGASSPPPGQAPAATASGGPGRATVLFAERSTWRKFFTGLTSRERVVQICLVAMCLALFILMKKFR